MFQKNNVFVGNNGLGFISLIANDTLLLTIQQYIDEIIAGFHFNSLLYIDFKQFQLDAFDQL